MVDKRINELPDGNATFTPTARIPYEDANDDTNTTKTIEVNELAVLDADNVFTGFNTFPTILATQNYEFSDLSTQEEGAVTFPFGWDITSSLVLQSFDTSGEDTELRAIFFRSDGLKMYTIGSTGDNVYEWDLSPAWDVASASFLQSFDVSGEDTLPVGLFFRSDGKKMYMVGTDTDSIYEYDVATAWDLSTVTSPAAASFDVSVEDTLPNAVSFRPDGLKMYMLGDSSNFLYEYNLSTAWDLSSATSPAAESFDVSGEDTTPIGLHFRSDGKKMYIAGATNNSIFEYDLTTPWDITTAVFSLQSFSVATQTTDLRGVFLKPDGAKMYIAEGIQDFVFEYDLGIITDGSAIFNGRIQGSEGASVASADIITLGNANIFEITGASQMNHMTTTGWQEGSRVTLYFAAINGPEIVSTTGTTPVDTADFFLDGDIPFDTTIDDTLSLTLAGGLWRETSRSQGG